MATKMSRPCISIKLTVCLITVILLFCFSADCFSSDDLDMENLFSSDEFFVETEELEDDSVSSELEDRSLNFSGSLEFRSRYTTKSDDYTLKTIFIDYVELLPDEIREQYQTTIDKIIDANHIGKDHWFNSTMTANLLMDVRLLENSRGFINLDAIYYPHGYSEYHIATDENQNTIEIEEEKNSDYVLKEIFIDANMEKKVFFRAGKQVLQWGRGYFFNPTDLINIEKKKFLDMDANREGTYGIKAHVPFGVKYNIYGFIDMGTEEEDTDDFAYAAKFEFLLDKTELSLSAWNKTKLDPVFGFDFSSRIGSFDIIGELSLTSKETVNRVNNDFTITKTEDTWVPRCSIGFAKSLDFNDINDRITIASELYYNHAGYSENIFDDPAKVTTLFANNLYSLYNHSTYYGIIFAEYKKLFITDLTLSLSGLGNFTDNSGIVMTQLKYTPLYDFTLECSLSSTLGDGDCEYTFTGDQTSVEFVAKIFF